MKARAKWGIPGLDSQYLMIYAMRMVLFAGAYVVEVWLEEKEGCDDSTSALYSRRTSPAHANPE